jgi:hypothetical protein
VNLERNSWSSENERQQPPRSGVRDQIDNPAEPTTECEWLGAAYPYRIEVDICANIAIQDQV